VSSLRALIYEKNLHRATELRKVAESAGYAARAVFYPAEAEAVFARERFDLLIAGFDALPLPQSLESAKRIVISVPQIMRKEVEAAAARYGITADIIEFPFEGDVAVAILKTSAKTKSAPAAVGEEDLPAILGVSPAIMEVKDLLLKAAQAPSTVLILGETGTGKELAARALHEAGPRVNRPFIALNCAATPETLLESEFFGHERGAFTGAVGRRAGKFEMAGDGTIFLDEMGDISPLLQAKLLRVLEEGSFYRVGGEKPVPMTARIICATNRDVFSMAQNGSFRRDLLYRINVLAVRLPPLRERGEDVHILAEHFLKKYADAFNKKNVASFSPDLSARMSAFAWPGNIRQLEHAVERAVLQCQGDEITDMPLGNAAETAAPAPPAIRDIAGLDYNTMKNKVMDFYEREYISAVLAKTNGSMQEACELSGMDRKTLYRKAKLYGLDKKDFKSKRR
jgi:DNA-binding NtrC family response regulator